MPTLLYCRTVVVVPQALPKAVALLGWGFGMSLLVVVGLLTQFTVHGEVQGEVQGEVRTAQMLNVRKVKWRSKRVCFEGISPPAIWC